MEDRFLYSELEDTIFIMIEGNATMKNSKTLSDLLKQIFDGEKKNLVFEMSKCNYLDSTFLGLIAKCALEIKKKWSSTLYILEMHKTLVDLNDKNKETFKNVVDMIEKDLEKQNK